MNYFHNFFNVWVFLNEKTKIKFTYQLACIERYAERTHRTSKLAKNFKFEHEVTRFATKKDSALVKSLSFSTLAITISPLFMLHRKNSSSKYTLNTNAYFASRISVAFSSPKTTFFLDEIVSVVHIQESLLDILTGAFLSIGFITNFLSLKEMFLISLQGNPIFGVSLERRKTCSKG